MMEIKVIDNLDDNVIEKLEDFGKEDFGEKDSNLDKLNPYGLKKIDDEEAYPKLDKIIEKFLKYYQGDGEGVFSWVEELNELAKDSEGENISYNGDSANQHYGLPTHINGDYKNGLIYHCLFNAGTNGVEDSLKTTDSKDDPDPNNCTLEEYYKIPEKDRKKGPKDINKLISKDKDKELKVKIRNVRNNIIGPDSLLTKELINERNGDERGYYCKKYYKKILEKNKDFYFNSDVSDENHDVIDKKISEKTNNLVNIELYPLRSKNKDGAEYEINKFSLFGAYIILYRIGKYLNEVKKDDSIQKPIFIFRSFTEWKDCIIAAIKNHFNFDEDTADELFEYLYDNYFLEFSSPNAGSVSSVNVMKKVRIGNERFDKMTACISEPKKPKNSAK